jgi:hypothetical protein
MSSFCVHMKIISKILLFITLTINLVAKDNLGITKLSQTITFPQIGNKTCLDSIFTLGATASSSLPVSFRIDNRSSAKAQLIGNSITVLGPGSILVECFQDGNEIYESASVTQNILITNPLPDLYTLKNNYIVCEGEDLSLEVQSFTGISALWTGINGSNVKATNLKIQNVNTTLTGQYDLKVSQAKCLIFQIPINITVNSSPIVSITSTFTEVFNNSDPIDLIAFPIGGTFSGLGVLNTAFDPQLANIGVNTIKYRYTNEKGCLGESKIAIEVKKHPLKELIVYELITAIRESQHTQWIIENIEEYPNNEVFIYDSWGILVFRKKNYSNENGWKAIGIPSGSYIYFVDKGNSEPITQGKLYIERE